MVPPAAWPYGMGGSGDIHVAATAGVRIGHLEQVTCDSYYYPSFPWGAGD